MLPMPDRAVAVFDGRRFLGNVSETKPALFEAIKPNGDSLGMYNS